jgi:hypothetical protein
MPEDGEPGGAITGAGVVNVQYAPVIQRKVGLCHHMTSLMTSAQAVLAGGTLISCPAPCTDNRSCRLADREGIGEGLKRHHPGGDPAILSAPHLRLAAARSRGGAAGVKRNWASQ